MGKAVANGMPLGIITGKREFMQELNHAFFSMTFGGECLSLAAAIATVKELRKKDYSELWRLGNLLDEGIKQAASKYGLDINFAGDAMRHNLTFNENYADPVGMKGVFYQEMVKQGILFSNVIYIQFSHTKKDILRTIKAGDKAFRIVADNINNLDTVLEGKRSVDIFRRNT